MSSVERSNGIVVYSLCTPDGVCAGVAATNTTPGNTPDQTLRTESDAIAPSRRLMRKSLGRRVGDAVISLQSAGRVSRLSFYEAGVLSLHLAQADDETTVVRAFEFWAYRPIRSVLLECSSVLVGAGDRKIQMVVTDQGAFYTEEPANCASRDAHVIHAAGPGDRAASSPHTAVHGKR
jgi:hypothetical protein